LAPIPHYRFTIPDSSGKPLSLSKPELYAF
jgi:hypothetical protein